jgi:hypothetical protein
MLVLLLGLSVIARAQDDELDTPRLGDGIPERVERLEREWAEDVGTKDPVDEPADAPDTDDAVEATPEHEPEAPKPAPRGEEPPPSKPRSALSNPLADPLGKRDAEGAASDPATTAPARRSSPAASRAERATTPEE